VGIRRREDRFGGVLPPDVVDRSKRADFGDSEWYAGRLYPKNVTVEDSVLSEDQEDRLGSQELESQQQAAESKPEAAVTWARPVAKLWRSVFGRRSAVTR
jgi:hypothetical protein